jgi:ribosomal protein S7
MKKQKIEIKNKIINRLLINGEKKTSEKVLLKSLKELQKDSNKNAKKLIQLAIVYSIPTFKLHKLTNKKKRKKKVQEIPAFILNERARISLAIKFILLTTKKKKTAHFYTKLKQEVLLNSQFKGDAIKIKDDLQKQILLKKHLFKYYRWH